MIDARQRLRDNILKRGALFFVLVWGVLFFGGGTFVIDLCFRVLARHEVLNTNQVIGIAFEKTLGGVLWGWIMWFFFLGKAAKHPR
ncbi:MAG: hypothetical protein WBE41_06665 [Terracidiphilus sp.]